MSLYVRIKKNFTSFKLDVDLSTNDVSALLGASGSGKSLTLKCIAGIVKPDEGVIILNGRTLFDSSKHINLPPQKRKVGYLFQNYALFPNMNVKDNIMCGMKTMPRFLSFIKQDRYKEIISLLKLEGLQYHKPSQLSGGEQQRVALARILVSSPDIILLDEPFSALDEHLRTTLQIEMKDVLKRFNKDVIIVTHNKDEASLLAGSIAIIDDGRVIDYQKTLDIFDNPKYIATGKILGYKNFSFIRNGLTEWGFSLPSKEGYNYISIGNDAFSIEEKENRHDIEVINYLRESSDYLVIFRFASQEKDSPNLFWRVKAKDVNIDKVASLGFKTKDIKYLIN